MERGYPGGTFPEGLHGTVHPGVGVISAKPISGMKVIAGLYIANDQNKVIE